MSNFHFNNYAPQSVSDKGKTHEETFGFTRASLRENFCKPHIMRNFSQEAKNLKSPETMEVKR
jgi:hypothetical protein